MKTPTCYRRDHHHCAGFCYPHRDGPIVYCDCSCHFPKDLWWALPLAFTIVLIALLLVIGR